MSVARRQQFTLNDNLSYTTGPILTKLHRNVLYVTLYKNSKRNLIRQKTWPSGAVAFRSQANLKNLHLKPVVKIQNNLVEIVTG